MKIISKRKDEKLNTANLNWGLFIITAILVGLGLVMVYSTSSVEASTSSMYGYNGYYFLLKQLRGVFLGLLAIFVISRIPLTFIRKMAWPILIVSIGFLILTIFFGVERNGAKRWLEIGGFSFQTSELCKLSLVLFLSYYLAANKKYITSFWRGVLPLLMVAGTIFVLIEQQPDLGTIIAIGITFMVMLLISGVRPFHLISMTIVGAGTAALMVIDKPYRVARIFGFLNPWKDPELSGFHIIQSLLAFGSGGLWGLGFGQSRQKLFYLPEQHTDFIFSVIGEELGFIGTAVTVLLFLAFAYIGFKIALSQKDLFSFLLASGMTGSIVFQAFINMGVASSMMPLTGMTLPFISFGSTSMIISLISVGILYRVSSSPPLPAVKAKVLRTSYPTAKFNKKSSYPTAKFNKKSSHSTSRFNKKSSYPTAKFSKESTSRVRVKKKRLRTGKLDEKSYPTSRLRLRKKMKKSDEDNIEAVKSIMN